MTDASLTVSGTAAVHDEAPGRLSDIASARLTYMDFLGLGLVTVSLLTAGLLMTHKSSFWYDEMATWTLVSDPSALHMLRTIAVGGENNPPLYHFVLRAWMAVFGGSESAMRALTSVSFAATAAVLWLTLRKAYRTRAVALGVTTALCGAKIVFDQLAQARFYGFFVLLTVIAVAMTFELARSAAPSRRMLIAAFASQLALVYCHLFGLLYSGALAVAIVLLDADRRRFRPRVYMTYIAAWIAFLPWVPATLQQATLAKPRSWIPRPTMVDFVRLVEKEAVWLPLTIVLIAVIAAWELRRRASDGPNVSLRTRADRQALQIIGLALILVVVTVFLESLVAVPVFMDRYVMPSVVGWAIVITHLAQMAGESSADGTLLGAEGTRSLWSLSTVSWSGFVLVIAAMPLAQACYAPSNGAPARVAVAPDLANVPIVMESALGFWPVHHYATEGQRVVFPLDWPLALDPKNAGASVQEYKLMRLYHERGYLGDDVQETSWVLCHFDRFVVVDEPDHLWLERRVASDSAYRVSDIPSSKPGVVLRLVERRWSNSRAACPADRSPSPSSAGS